MVFITTVGELRAAIAGLTDDARISVWSFGSRTTIKEIGIIEGEALIVPIGTGELFDAAEELDNGGKVPSELL